MHKKRNPFIEGAITASFIAESIAKHSSKTNIGAHSIFLGQVRGDEKEGGTVVEMEYSSYHEMAETVFEEIRQAAFDKFPLVCLHIHHSLGVVLTGEICLFVFASSVHRASAISAVSYVVERVKTDVPIWGMERSSSGDVEWKLNVNTGESVG